MGIWESSKGNPPQEALIPSEPYEIQGERVDEMWEKRGGGVARVLEWRTNTKEGICCLSKKNSTRGGRKGALWVPLRPENSKKMEFIDLPLAAPGSVPWVPR